MKGPIVRRSATGAAPQVERASGNRLASLRRTPPSARAGGMSRMVCPNIAARMRSAVIASPTSSSNTWPLRNTSTREQKPTSSSISLDMIDDRLASRREIPQMRIEIGLGADVDAARRIVEDQDVRAQREGAADQHFLLVAAAERGDLVAAIAHADRQFLALPLERARQRGPIDDREFAAARFGAIERQQHVLENAEIGENALALAIARDIADADGARRRRGC